MISAPNTRSQKYLVGVIQATPGTPGQKYKTIDDIIGHI